MNESLHFKFLHCEKNSQGLVLTRQIFLFCAGQGIRCDRDDACLLYHQSGLKSSFYQICSNLCEWHKAGDPKDGVSVCCKGILPLVVEREFPFQVSIST